MPLAGDVAQRDDHLFHIPLRVAERRGIRHQRCAALVRLHAELAVEKLGLLHRARQERGRVPVAAAVRAPPALVLELSAHECLASMAQDAFRSLVDELHPPRRFDDKQALLHGLDEARERLLHRQPVQVLKTSTGAQRSLSPQ